MKKNQIQYTKSFFTNLIQIGKKNYSFHFTTKVIKQKMSTGTVLMKYFFFAIFSKLLKLEPYLEILLFYDVNLTATVHVMYAIVITVG